jgi:hypothetical protein
MRVQLLNVPEASPDEIRCIGEPHRHALKGPPSLCTSRVFERELPEFERAFTSSLSPSRNGRVLLRLDHLRSIQLLDFRVVLRRMIL